MALLARRIATISACAVGSAVEVTSFQPGRRSPGRPSTTTAPKGPPRPSQHPDPGDADRLPDGTGRRPPRSRRPRAWRSPRADAGAPVAGRVYGRSAGSGVPEARLSGTPPGAWRGHGAWSLDVAVVVTWEAGARMSGRRAACARTCQSATVAEPNSYVDTAAGGTAPAPPGERPLAVRMTPTIEPIYWIAFLAFIGVPAVPGPVRAAPQRARGVDPQGRDHQRLLDPPRRFVVLAGDLALLGGAGGQYFTGYVIEKSLSVDNVFVWAVILVVFRRPAGLPAPGPVLGRVRRPGARAIFIFAGVALLEAISWMFYVFGAFLVFTPGDVAPTTRRRSTRSRNPICG